MGVYFLFVGLILHQAVSGNIELKLRAAIFRKVRSAALSKKFKYDPIVSRRKSSLY